MNEPLYLCVYVPEFAAQAMLRLRRNLAEKPVAVLEGVPPFEQVCSINALAAKAGVARGMTKAELDSFPGLSILRRSAPEERAAHAALLEAAGTFTPRVEIFPSASSAFVMVLDMTGATRIFGSAQQIAQRIAQTMEKLHFFTHRASSANLHTALCLAPAVRRLPIHVPIGQERKHLASLPLAALRLTPQQAETFSLWGLNTLGELANLPEVDLVVRLGQTGKRLHLLACGQHPHLMVPEEQAFTLDEFVAFDSPMESMDSLLFVLGPMLDQLLARAQNRSFALASVTLTLGLDGSGEHIRAIKPALPVLQREVLLKLLHLDLIAHPPSAGVISLLAHAEPGDRSKVQLGLFAPQLPEPLRLDVTLARIAALVGEDRIGRARLLDTHRPDSFVLERFTTASAQSAKEIPLRFSGTLRRCRPPLPLFVQHEAESLAAFFALGKHYRVQKAFGPWRKSGDWWSSGVWSYEEWDIRAAAANDDILLCILAHDLLRQSWQLEALYD